MKRKQPKIAVALAFLEANPGASKYQAALHAKMKPTSLYARLKKDAALTEGKCPCCGQEIAKAPP